MSMVSAEFRVSVTLDIDEDYAPKVTKDDLIEMACSAVGHHHGGKGVQLVCGGKCMWTKEYVRGQMKAEDAEFADVQVEAYTDCDFNITDVDDEFSRIHETEDE